METEAREVKCCPLAAEWVGGHRINDVTVVPGDVLPIDTGASVYLGGAWQGGMGHERTAMWSCAQGTDRVEGISSQIE